MKTKWIFCRKEDFVRNLNCDLISDDYEFYNLDYLSTICYYFSVLDIYTLYPSYRKIGFPHLEREYEVLRESIIIDPSIKVNNHYYSYRDSITYNHVNNIFQEDFSTLLECLSFKLNNFNYISGGELVKKKDSEKYVFIRYILLQVVLSRISKVKIS